MDSKSLINKAIEKGEVEKLLCGEGEYEIPVTEFTSEVLPTEIDCVLADCFYQQWGIIKNIDRIFSDALNNLIESSASSVYVAFLYYSACILDEEENEATFQIDRELLSKKLRKKIDEHEAELRDAVEFSNGEKKKNPWKYIFMFNEFCKRKYGFYIV